VPFCLVSKSGHFRAGRAPLSRPRGGIAVCRLKLSKKISALYQGLPGGEGGIRTPDRLAPMPHFECGAFNHSATSPWCHDGGSRPPVVGASSRRGRRVKQGADSEIARPAFEAGWDRRTRQTRRSRAAPCDAGREGTFDLQREAALPKLAGAFEPATPSEA
jgi:hypothetical protein